MKKYFIVGTLAFSLIATTVYAFNDESSNYNNKLVNNYHNCQYHNGNEVCPYYENKDAAHECLYVENGNCPYYDKTTGTHSVPDNTSEKYHHNSNVNYGNGHGRNGGCRHHYNR